MNAPRLPDERQYSRAEARQTLMDLVGQFAIDPYDARVIAEELPADTIGVDDFAELFEMQGYPNLAEMLYSGEI